MKKCTTLLIIVAFVGMNCTSYGSWNRANVETSQKPGTQLIIQEKDGQEVVGELIAVKNDSLLLLLSDSGADLTIDVECIKTIIVLKKARVFSGVVIGGMIGALIGLLPSMQLNIGFGFGTPASNTAQETEKSRALLIGALGAAVGGLFGAASGIDKAVHIDGKSEAEIINALDDLRKQARIPDYQ